MNIYLESEFAHKDVNKFGVYNEARDDVNLTLCPQNCGGLLIGHLYHDKQECLQKLNTKYADITKNESAKLIDKIKKLPNWNKAKLMWIREPEKCK